MKRIQICFVVVAIAFLSCGIGVAAEKPTARDWFQMGVEFEKSQVYDEAIKMYTEAIRFDPYYAEAYFRRGKAYAAGQKTRTEEAFADYNSAIDLDPRNAEAYYARGLLNAFVLNNERAREDMRTAAGLGNKEAQQWLAPPDRQQKDKEVPVAAAVPGTGGTEQPPAQEEKAVTEAGGAFFGPGKRLPSGNEPVVHFDFNKADIKEQYYPVLDEVALVLTEKAPEAIVVLAGHTDNTGTERYNDALSLRRAKAAASYLADKCGVPPNRLIVKGYGEGSPVATNDTAEGRAKNRRVEILDAGKPGEPPPAEKP